MDNYSKKWNKIKKMIHEYEYIYTSPNMKKNISSIIPISRSYYKLKEIISEIWMFIFVLLLALLLMIFFPEIILWVPEMFGYKA